MGHYSHDEAMEIARIHLQLASMAGDTYEDGTLERLAAAVSEAETEQEAADAANRVLAKHLVDGPRLRQRLGGIN